MRTRRPHLVFAALMAACAFGSGAASGCGRIGFALLPIPDAEPNVPVPGPQPDASQDATVDAMADAGTDPPPDATIDTGVTDAGTTDTGVTDASTTDTGVVCPTACSNSHGTADCASGSCQLSCAVGFADCDLDPGNGCEADTSAMAESCGGCAMQCTNDNGSSACVDGLCSLSCTTGYADCDADPNTGCETSLNSTMSCGACDNECSNPHGSTACVSETCQPTCDTGYADCDGNPDNGCEADLQNDPSHCGSCPNACGTNGQICVYGACQASPCAAGLGECDGDLTVTCETDLTSDVDHCGFCANACTTSNGTAACTNGACEVGSCDPGYDDCDGDPGDCEVDLTTSVDHCGACNAACTNAHGTTRCTGSTCDPTCSSGWEDCDGNPANGCETSLTSVSDCGMCGRSCSGDGGTPICDQGVCETLCDLTGTFAVHLRVRATWSATGGIRSGSGWFDWWARLDTSHDGDTADAQVHLCGATIPPFSAQIVSETSLYLYPNSLFDGGDLPVVSTTLTLGDSTPDSSLSLPTSVFLLGLTMTDPLNDSWPSSASGLPGSDRVDMDGDGHPGVTAHFVEGDGYVYPRTSTSWLPNRADRDYVAARTSFSLNGALSSCTESSGSADFPHIQVRVLGCRRDGGGNCTSGEADHLDDSSPPFSLSNGSYTMTKVADGASCATVRSALP